MKKDSSGTMPPAASSSETPEVPAHEAPHAEAGEEVDDVEPAVGDEDAEREVEPVAGRLRALGAFDDGREPQEAAGSAEEELEAEGVLHDHLARTSSSSIVPVMIEQTW